MDKESKGIDISQIFILLLILALLFVRWTKISEDNSKVMTVKNGYSLEYGPYEKIDINSAGIDKLKMVPGVGDVIAERIIEFRKENGFFSDINDIEKVSGIGKKKKEIIKKFVTFK